MKHLQTPASKPAEWSRQSIINALTKWLTEKIAPLHKKSLDGTITEREDMFETALVELRSFVNSPSFQIGKDVSKDWSEEDEKIRKTLIDFVEQYGHNYYGAIARASAISWLERQGEQKSAWNDEKMISLLIEIFKVNHPNEHFKANPPGTTNMEVISTGEIIDWLKSLKNRLKGE